MVRAAALNREDRPPPPGPFRPQFWRSPLRGPALTSILGLILLALLTIVIVTGFLSHAAYDPDLGTNAVVPRDRDLQLLVFDWPTRPVWLYAATQGLHVTLGIIVVPLLLAKLWSVIPKLWAWPPVQSPAQGLERLSLLALVGGAAFQFATGIANAQLWYPFHFGFVRAHYYGAWIFTAALVLHVATKVPVMRAAYRTRGEVAAVVATATPPPPVAPERAEGTISRRGLFALVGGAMGALAVVTAGQSIGGPLRRLAVLAPRGRGFGTGPNDFQVNITATTAGIDPARTGASWRLALNGTRSAALSRPDLLRLAQTAASLPIACVEGWSTTQHWSGVRIADLAALAGRPDASSVLVRSLEKRGKFSTVTLSRDQLHDPHALLALHVNGEDLSLDHGFPARIIIPAAPGVHCTKWVASMEFHA
jgi:DMSO/TMAO reductase YedYZ molybdopterin-dependent catalytic subunit